MTQLVPVDAPIPFAQRLTPILDFGRQPAVRRALPAIGLALSLFVALLAWLALSEPAQRPVFDGLAEADKAAVASALDSGGIAHGVDGATGSVTVAEEDYHRARMLLAAQGLPKGAPGGDAVRAALPMGASRALEGETLKGAREADLARTIEGIDAIKAARVHLAVAEPSPFLRDDEQSAASVMLTLQAGRALSDGQVRAIQHLVASSVPELKVDAVSVVDQSGRLLTRTGGPGDASLELQARVEERTSRALATLLTPLVGADGFTAEVTASLDLSESQSTRESYPKDDRALSREEGNRSVAPELAAGGIPGALSNMPPASAQVTTTPPVPQQPGPATSAPAQETYTRSFDNGREISVTHQPVGRLKRLSVAVVLREQGKPRTAKELATIEQLVKGAVGFDQSRGDVVAIASRPFVATEAAKPAFYEQPWFLSALKQGGAVLGAIVAFLLVGRPLKRMLKAREERAQQRDDLEARLLQANDRPSSVTLDMIAAAPSYEAKANLVRQFVRQDPEKAAAVVRDLLQGPAHA